MGAARSNPARRPARRVVALLVAAIVLAGCHGTPSDPAAGTAAASREAVVVASFDFDESRLLAEIYAQALERAGIPVRREFGLGPRELVLPALREGLVDVVPEYLGTALRSVDPRAAVGASDGAAVLAALRRELAPDGLVPLRPAAAQDQNGFAVTRARAATSGLRTVSDWAALRPPLVLGGPPECAFRPYCLPGLQRRYGLHVRSFVPFADAAQRMAALSDGVVDVAVTFTTDGHLATGDPVLLRDDRHLQPAENVVPVVSARALARYGARLRAPLDAVSAALDSAALRFLNWRVSVLGNPVPAEAAGWLERHRLALRR